MKRRAWAIAGSIVLVAIALLIVWLTADPLRSSARRKWKNEAIAKIQARVDDKTWIQAELTPLKAWSATGADNHWVGTEMLLMRDGDWMICQNICAKEQKPGVRKDLFIGRGSNGKWYYSTYHFCVGLMVLKMDGQPQDLAEMARTYHLAEFDGVSDECLKATTSY